MVIGEVSSAAGEWAAGRSSIQTRVTLTGAELLKGTAPAPLTFTQLGGQVGNEASAIGGGPGFQPGERVLGISDQAAGRFPAVGRSHLR